MRRMVFIFVLAEMLSVRVFASQVEWNIISVEYYYASTTVGCLIEPSLPFYVPLHMQPSGAGLMVTTEAERYLEYANTLALARYGDVVMDDYMENKGEWFAYARYSDYNNEQSHSDYSIFVSPDESVYLVFRSETMYNESTIFGWIELGLDDAGNLTALQSAWDKSGDPIRVGAIPEPSGALLLLVGGALLALRRRNIRSGFPLMGARRCEMADK